MYTKGKQDVANALAAITGVNVAASYALGMKSIPCIIYNEIVNVKANKGRERLVRIHYAIDIYSKTSTTSIADKVDKALTGMGLSRLICLDLDDPSGLRHKNMKYGAVIDTVTGLYYED